MNRSIWISAWDIAGRDPQELIDELRTLGLDACNVGLGYHGGRMLLPRNGTRVVHEFHPGAVYFPADTCRFGKLRPHVSLEAAEMELFLRRCEAERFPVRAWIVACHNDHLGYIHEDCCVENACGEKYRYALCPSNPDVVEYAAELCRQAAALPGVQAIDLEALGFLGFEHGSLHDKRGINVGTKLAWLLSICFCEHCCANLEGHSEALRKEVRRGIREAFDTGVVKEDVPLNECVQARKRSLTCALAALSEIPIHLRLYPDYRHSSGKTGLMPADVAGSIAAVTLTYFGQGTEHIREQVTEASRHVAVHGGISFLQPDIGDEESLLNRVKLVRDSGVCGMIFYHYGMATARQLAALHSCLEKTR